MLDSTTPPHETPDEGERSMKIKTLRDMVNNAEKTIQSAKAMLLQLEGKKKAGRPRKMELDETNGTVIEGTFDGQIMMGADGKQYPVPANYASKSKLVEGDMLKLTITENGTFLYKQIGPIERRHALGIVTQDESGNYAVIASGKAYRVLLASITYFKATPGDEVAVVVPRDMESSWAAIENVIQKGASKDWQTNTALAARESSSMQSWKKDLHDAPEALPAYSPSAHSNSDLTSAVVAKKPAATVKTDPALSPLDAWVRDMEEIEKEMNQQKP